VSSEQQGEQKKRTKCDLVITGHDQGQSRLTKKKKKRSLQNTPWPNPPITPPSSALCPVFNSLADRSMATVRRGLERVDSLSTTNPEWVQQQKKVRQSQTLHYHTILCGSSEMGPVRVMSSTNYNQPQSNHNPT